MRPPFFLSASALVQTAITFAPFGSRICLIGRHTTVIFPSIAFFATFVLLVGHIEPPHQRLFTLSDKG